MLGQHLVRVGAVGQVGRFASADSQRYARGTRVICRTGRGLELGEVLAPVASDKASQTDGTLLRRVTVEDDLLAARLGRYKTEAYEACQEKIRQRGLSTVLVDVEHLFDGQSLFFYFLGETSPELDAITAELAETYESKVQFRKFADALTTGCGPGCGTDEAENGCTSGACSTCSVLAACGGSKRKG